MAKLTSDQYFLDCNIKHNYFYDYSDSIFKTVKEKIIINCPLHGKFEQRADMHKHGSGCKQCGIIKNSKNISISNTYSNQQYIDLCNIKHNYFYNYSKVDYQGSASRIIIGCPKHGDFIQIAGNHLHGDNCPQCAIDIKIKNQTKTQEQYLIEVNIAHNNKYIYPNLNYKHSQEKINIECSKHGEFSQIAASHLKGAGCPKCFLESKTKTTEEFIIQAKLVHQCDDLHYHKVKYINSSIKVWIHCSKENSEGLSHGDFDQLPGNHLIGRGCPKCSNIISKQEHEITNFLNELNVKNIITNTYNILETKQLDIYLPDYKLAIEYNGLYWHSDKFRDDNYHLEKTKECEALGIQLIHIFEDEYINKPDIVFSRLRNIIGKSTEKFYARKTFIKSVESSVAREFLNNNHIQGFTGSQYYFGLYIHKELEPDELVSIMSFGSLRKNLGNTSSNDNDYELVRFCNKLNTNVIGGASKLFKYFIRNHKPKNIISYADKRWSQGKLYETLGFTLSHESKPNYFYVNGQKRENRFNYRKDILVSKYGCLINDTERNFTKQTLELNRIYDCGTKVYKYSINK